MKTANYCIHIRSTSDKVWDALTKPELTRQWFTGKSFESDWKVGSAITMVAPQGETINRLPAVVTSSDKPNALGYLFDGGMFGSFNYELSQVTPSEVRLTVHHNDYDDAVDEIMTERWYGHLSSLKSLIETGKALDHSRWD